jgi:cell shape-determining protein MreC
MVSYEEKKELFENIKILVKPEQDEVFRIIRKSKENYTENSNGIFFDLLSISENTLLEIREYINFCLKTRQEHEVRLKELEDIRSENEKYIAEN